MGETHHLKPIPNDGFRQTPPILHYWKLIVRMSPESRPILNLIFLDLSDIVFFSSLTLRLTVTSKIVAGQAPFITVVGFVLTLLFSTGLYRWVFSLTSENNKRQRGINMKQIKQSKESTEQHWMVSILITAWSVLTSFCGSLLP